MTLSLESLVRFSLLTLAVLVVVGRSGVQREKSCLGHNKSSKEKELLDRYMLSPVTSLT